MDLTKYQFTVHENSKEKGFWEEGANRSKGEMVALIVSELSEAVEAHRKSKWCTDDLNVVSWTGGSVFTEWFERGIKDTIEDEIADTVIRILDYTKGWNIPLYQRECRIVTTDNFAHDVLRLQKYVIEAFEEDISHDWGYVLAAIEKFCLWYDIPLEEHMQLKIQYNSTRPHKHNKAY